MNFLTIKILCAIIYLHYFEAGCCEDKNQFGSDRSSFHRESDSGASLESGKGYQKWKFETSQSLPT